MSRYFCGKFDQSATVENDVRNTLPQRHGTAGQIHCECLDIKLFLIWCGLLASGTSGTFWFLENVPPQTPSRF
jgi:hypothetical protein